LCSLYRLLIYTPIFPKHYINLRLSFKFCSRRKIQRMSIRNSEIETNGWTTFDVPNQFEDLQKPLATGSYYVQNILDLADINTRLQSQYSI
jgi:hypothetical protein